MFTAKHTQLLQSLMARFLKTDRAVSLGQSDDGLTLIECLVAIVMIGLVVGTVTPALVISAATRIQSQRTEQAVKIAQGEIDRVRTVVERGTYSPSELPQSTAVTTQSKTGSGGKQYIIEYADSVNGPVAANLRAESTPYSSLAPFDAKQVDVDGDGVADLAVQVYRSPGRTNTAVSSAPVNFVMGVRVYDIKAFQKGTGGNLPKTRASIKVTGGEGDRGRLPLAVLYTSVAKGDVDNSYCDYFRYLGSTPSANFECD